MTPNHHLDDATLLRYAAGDLDEAFLVIAASHIALCPQCARAARDATELGGHYLEDCTPAQISDWCLDELLHRIDTEGGPAHAEHRSVQAGDVPAPLQQYIGTRLGDVNWKTVAPGVQKHDIKLTGSQRRGQALYMLNIAPGKAVPEHGHGGNEMTLVLSGAYRDAMGRFGPGDVADLDEHVEHQPHVDADASCICIVATEAPTRFRSIFARLLQPLVGI